MVVCGLGCIVVGLLGKCGKNGIGLLTFEPFWAPMLPGHAAGHARAWELAWGMTRTGFWVGTSPALTGASYVQAAASGPGHVSACLA